MADTRAYRDAEEWVRTRGLVQRFGMRFTRRKLVVGAKEDNTPVYHEFDAVSEDVEIVASVKASSGRTAGGKFPTGKVKGAYFDLYFLQLARASMKILVLTDPAFFEIFRRDSNGKLPTDVQVLHLPLPRVLQDEVDEARKAASLEMTRPREQRGVD